MVKPVLIGFLRIIGVQNQFWYSLVFKKVLKVEITPPPHEFLTFKILLQNESEPKVIRK